MALMLRKHCTSVLEAHQLGEYHADISENNPKTLQLFNPCGKIFLEVPGITFSSARPTIAEITYAGELLDAWLQTNRKKITRFLAAKEWLASSPDPVDSEGPLSIVKTRVKNQYGQHRAKSVYGCALTLPKNVVIHFDLDGAISRISADFEERIEPETLPRFLPNASELQEVQNKLAEISTYQDATEAVYAAQAALNSCCTV